MRSWPRLLFVPVVVGVVILLTGAGGSSSPSVRPDDPAFVRGTQWNLTAIGAPTAWRWGTGRGETIAIVDSGVDLGHVDLAAHIVGSTDCVGSGGDPRACRGLGTDDNGHGSHVAGIAAAVTDNRVGLAGVAPDARLLAIRVLSSTCAAASCPASGNALDVAAGIRWATAHRADVINLSIGTDDDSLQSPAVAQAITTAWHAGVIVVAAAGNQVVTTGFASLPVIVVTAVDRNLRLASYAPGVGPARWGLAAPGGEAGDGPSNCRAGGQVLGIFSTSWNPAAGPNQYACLSGTSMAAPEVSGAAAVLRSIGYSPRATVARLLATARVLGQPGRDTTYGSGLLALDRAAHPGSVATAIRSSASLAAVRRATEAGEARAGLQVVQVIPGRPPLLPTMLAGVLLALSSATAVMIASRIWRDHAAARRARQAGRAPPGPAWPAATTPD